MRPCHLSSSFNLMNSFLAFAAQYLFLSIPLAIVLLWSKLPKERRVSYAVQAIATGMLAVALAQLSKHFIDSPRPFVVGHFTPIIHATADNGFPSDHTMLSATLAMLILLVNRKLGIAALGVALLVGVARIALGVHSPIDIVGSFAIALIATASVALASSALGKRNTKK